MILKNQAAILQSDVVNLVHILQTNNIPVPENILEHKEIGRLLTNIAKALTDHGQGFIAYVESTDHLPHPNSYKKAHSLSLLVFIIVVLAVISAF